MNQWMEQIGKFGWVRELVVEGSDLSLRDRFKLYLRIALLLLAVIWTVVGVLLAVTPEKYISHWTLILPGAGSGAQVSLDSLGQASASSNSPYSSSAIDPRENYKAIVLSDVVIAAAAASLDKTSAAFGKPKLKLPTQTGLMVFSSQALTAEDAQAKAWALYQALQSTLDELRDNEIHMREEGVRKGLDGFATKVGQSQRNIIAYQSERGLVSLDQFKELAISSERLRQKRIGSVSKLQGIEARERKLIEYLGLTASQAGDVLKLKNDQLYQELLVNDTTLHAEAIRLSGILGDRHPRLVALRQEQEQVRVAMNERCRVLIDNCGTRLMRMLSADDVDGRAQLMQQLISLASDAEGLREELRSLDHELVIWDKRLEESKQDAAKLAELNREHQLASAVFTSAMARMDVGKADIYSAYPLLQILAKPSLPSSPDRVGFLLTLVGGAAASLSVLIGLGLLWVRKPILSKILTKK